MIQKRFLSFAGVLAVWHASLWAAAAQSSVNRGLWVGEVTLNAVNEVAVPLDEKNVPRAPDAKVPTKTFDGANLRLILHVDGTGHVSLLKSVAVLSRTGQALSSASDMALVTDEHLYGEFPPQAAVRIASAVFDFGDSKATEAVNKVVSAASEAATTAVLANKPEADTITAARTEANKILAEANAVQRFSNFLLNDANTTIVNTIATSSNPTTAAAPMRLAAETLRTGSFYADARGVEMVDGILAAIAASVGTDAKKQAAQNTAASFADTSDNYERFLAGRTFGSMIPAAAEAAAAAAVAAPLKVITNFESGGASLVKVTSAGHGLNNLDEIAIQGSAVAAYNGIWKVTALAPINANAFTIPVPFVAGGAVAGYQAHRQVAPLVITSPAHGLSSGAKVTIYDAAVPAYNGAFLVTVMDADKFSIPVPFISDPAQKGKWSVRSGLITGYEGTTSGVAGVKISAPAHGLSNGQEIEIAESGKASYNGTKTITRIDNDTFSIPQAFDGDPAIKGIWSVRASINQYSPPAVVTTLVTANGHGLATGDRITISGSGNAPYNGAQQVTVVDPNSFEIPVVWEAGTGDPALKGIWAPVISGSWRRVASLRVAVNANTAVKAAQAAALDIKVQAYSDTRGGDAVNVVLEAIIAAAATAEAPIANAISATANTAGRNALVQKVKRYAQPATRPSSDYSSFVAGADFQGSAATAAASAAAGALFAKNANTLLASDTSAAGVALYTQAILDQATQQATTDLVGVFAAAARTTSADLPLVGAFGPGSHLTGTLVLPANHPTNPFRHFRHPNHTSGFDITRIVDLSFDGATNDPLATAGFGVDRISGIYEEEIKGLHKPLGPNKDTGLKVKGTFQLNRISLIETLNGL